MRIPKFGSSDAKKIRGRDQGQHALCAQQALQRPTLAVLTCKHMHPPGPVKDPLEGVLLLRSGSRHAQSSACLTLAKCKAMLCS